MMGGGSPPPPQIIYPPAAPPPAPTTQVPTQALASQAALNEVSGKQQRLNMELGAQLARTNAECFATQDIRRGQAGGAEQRLTIDKAGEDTRATARVQGQEQRAGIAETGAQTRATKRVEGQEVRETDLQREMFRRYKEARDYGQAQTAYKA